MYEAYKRGTEALKSLRESSGFTVDDIDEVAVNLQDALQANQEISEALNTGNLGKLAITTCLWMYDC